MEFANLGRTGLKVSRICLGCMTYGKAPEGEVQKAGRHAWTLDEGESRPFFRQAVDAGINFFDTANVYSSGASEVVLGRFLKEHVRREGRGCGNQSAGRDAGRAEREGVVPKGDCV